MSPTPRTTVVIPTYNRGEMAVEAARSVLAQTVPVGLVVVDDGSTDDTPARLEALVKEAGAEALTVIRQENAERGAARNRGAREAPDAEFYLFLDADDALEPGHVEGLEALADTHPGASLVASAGFLCDAGLRAYGILAGSRGRVTLSRFVTGAEPLPPTLTLVPALRFREVGVYDEDRSLSGSEDWLLHARLLALGPGVRHGTPTARIRRHGGNTMADPERMLISMLLAHEKLFGKAEGEEADALVGLERSSRARLLLNASTQFYAVGMGGKARQHLLEAVREDPRVMATPLWAWTWVRSLLPHRLARALREWKGRLATERWGEAP